jgi:adenylosuccinate lyase
MAVSEHSALSKSLVQALSSIKDNPDQDFKVIKTALVSVFDKTGLEDLAGYFLKHKIHVLSTGGTAKKLEELGVAVQEVADYSSSPEILDGRVKTLHPKIHGGLLAAQGSPAHEQQLAQHGIKAIDLVIGNFYPFEEAVKRSGGDYATCIENIDIGGPTMIRASAMNSARVVVLSIVSQYTKFLERAVEGGTHADLRSELASEAFQASAAYDASITRYFQSHIHATREKRKRQQEEEQTMPAVKTQKSGRASHLDGKALSEKIIGHLRQRVLEEDLGSPHLHVVSVGDDPASKVYIQRKRQAAERIGSFSRNELPESTTLDELRKAIDEKNRDDTVHGIIVQLPLPAHLQKHQREVLDLVDPLKDVDCFHPINVGKMSLGEPGFRPATPAGILALLKYNEIPLQGKHVVVLGKSEIVGKPLALMLGHEQGPAATVTMCDRFTQNTWDMTRTADVVVVAAGKHHLLSNPSALRPDGSCVVVDVGIHRVKKPDGKFGVQGDVDYNAIVDHCRWITPVPGGVGPMTVACLLEQVVEAARLQRSTKQVVTTTSQQAKAQPMKLVAESLSPLTAISPCDGRYARSTLPLREICSEYGLIRHRVKVEVEWLRMMSETPEISEVPPLSETSVKALVGIVDCFGIPDAQRVKEFERTTNHDVKAIEYLVKEKMDKDPELRKIREFTHFACTSEDINNLSYAGIFKEALGQVLLPSMHKLLEVLASHAKESADSAMMSLTHGQPATPTTFGKEMANVARRLSVHFEKVKEVPIMGKFNGASGNFNAHRVAYPQIDWPALSERFVQRLGLVYQPYSTQIECHDFVAELCHGLMRFNTTMIDFCRDMWSYISRGILKLKPVAGETGSSTMPHKVNPIDFENAEGNLGVANALLGHFAEKLPISRMQRDLTDSTVFRVVGVAFAHSLIAYTAAARGLGKIAVSQDVMMGEVSAGWNLLAEPIQTVMRKAGMENPYERLKELTRGQEITEEIMQKFVAGLNLPDASDQTRLSALRPETYLGEAPRLAKQIQIPSLE